MGRSIAVGLLFVTAVAACGSAGTGVSRTGYSVRDGRVGFGGLIRTTGPVRNIGLEVTMRDEGRAVRTDRDTLVYCAPERDCWWGNSFVADEAIDEVDIRIVASEAADDDIEAPRELPVTRRSGEVRLRAPGEEGVVYLLAFERGTPRFAISFFTRRDEQGQLRYSRALFPARGDEAVRAFFYPGPVPSSAYGPSD